MQNKIDWPAIKEVSIFSCVSGIVSLGFIFSLPYAHPTVSVFSLVLSVALLFISARQMEIIPHRDRFPINSREFLTMIVTALTCFPLVSILFLDSVALPASLVLVQFLLLIFVYNRAKVDAGYIWIVNGKVYHEGETIKLNPFLVYKISSLPVNLGRTIEIVLTDMPLPCREGIYSVTIKTNIQVKLNPSGNKITNLDYKLFMQEIKEWLRSHVLSLAADKTFLEFLASLFHAEPKCIIQGLEVNLFNFDPKEVKATVPVSQKLKLNFVIDP